MSRTIQLRSTIRRASLPCMLGAVLFTACVSSPPGLSMPEVAGSAGAAGAPETAQGGMDNVPAAGGAPMTDGGDAPGGADGGNPDVVAQAGDAAGGSLESGGGSGGGGSPPVGAAGEPAQGAGGTLGVKILAPCPFHSDAPPASGGTGGAGGGGSGGTSGSGGNAGTAGSAGTGGNAGTGGSSGAGPTLTVTVQTSPFVGTYLADSTGRSLYTYGADLPGDCNTPPVSQCVTDCLVSWPLFPASTRLLAAGLDDNAFGAIQRSDGTWQTTYFGWPLYYYKTDLTLGQVAGQGKGKTWHLAQVKLPGVVIMSKTGSPKYLGDRSGHTLYVSSADQAASGEDPPVSACSGSCLSTFEPFHEENFSVVTSLAMADFGAFVPVGTGALQVTYKGKPLYRAATDLKSGDMTGTASAGFTAALP